MKKPVDKINFFKSEVARFQKEFNLLDWDIIIKEDPDKNGKNEASVDWYPTTAENGGGRSATIFYDKTWIENVVNFRDISSTVLHEILEIRLSRLRDFSRNNTIYISPREVDDEVHSIIRVFENKWYPKI